LNKIRINRSLKNNWLFLKKELKLKYFHLKRFGKLMLNFCLKNKLLFLKKKFKLTHFALNTNFFYKQGLNKKFINKIFKLTVRKKRKFYFKKRRLKKKIFNKKKKTKKKYLIKQYFY